MANYEINDIYDIATAFITDQNTTVTAKNTDSEITYVFTTNVLGKQPYSLTIHAIKKAPEKLQSASASPMSDGRIYRENKIFTKKHYGQIKLSTKTTYSISCITTEFETNLLTYTTKHEVGSALDKTQCDLRRFMTRIRCKKFFNLLDLAEKRISGQIATTDNSKQIFDMIYRLKQNTK